MARRIRIVDKEKIVAWRQLRAFASRRGNLLSRHRRATCSRSRHLPTPPSNSSSSFRRKPESSVFQDEVEHWSIALSRIVC